MTSEDIKKMTSGNVLKAIEMLDRDLEWEITESQEPIRMPCQISI